MKLLVVMQHENFFRNLETVVRELDSRGHETVMLYADHPSDARVAAKKAKAKAKGKQPKMAHMGRGIEVAEAEVPGLSTGLRADPVEGWQRKLRVGRQLINRGIYFRRDHPSPERVTDGLEKQLPEPVRGWLRWRVVRGVLGRRATLRAWRRLERAGRASASVTEGMREIDPDVVLVSPSVWPKNPVEADYLRAARALGIPSVGYLNSWDNLTSKGTVHLLPDVFVVWNEALAAEARDIHLIPGALIEVTGAPHVDHFFEAEPSRPRDEIARQMGCTDDGPYVVYLCSSRTLIADETAIVSALAETLVRELGEAAPTVVVRPHPVNVQPWERYRHAGVVVFPERGDQADTPESWQAYFDQLSGASAFVGLNTTAFLEAAVADKPCLTIVSQEFFAQQGRTGHFRHLLDADFLEVSEDVEGVAGRIGRVLDGVDEKAAQRKRFAESFLRPRGIDVAARSVVADLLERLAPAGRQVRQDPSPVPAMSAVGDE